MLCVSPFDRSNFDVHIGGQLSSRLPASKVPLTLRARISKDSRFLLASTLQSAGARRYWVIWIAVVPIALWAIVRAFGLESGGLLTGLMWFTPYAATAALLVLGVAVALRNWAAAMVATLAAASLAVAVLPRTIGSDVEQPAGRQTLTVLSSNVYLGAASATDLVALVDRYQPDLLSVQELTPSFDARLRRAGLKRQLPYAMLMPQPRGRGGGLYARYPLTRLALQTHFRFRMPRAMLTLPGGRRLRVVSVHPMPPNMSYDEWRMGLESLPTPGSGIPWVLAGDFNGTFDQAEFRDVVDSGYRDAADATGNGLQPTWPTDEVLPWGVMTIDHVLADRRLGVADFGVVSLEGSDHRAIHARLVLP
jgi:endonuclease/exonuclease/phosphatase (EEP) superfamily protein YafD